jgi:hypothetical protein
MSESGQSRGVGDSGIKRPDQQGLANWCDSDAVPHFLVPQHLRCVRNGRLVIPARTLFCRGRNAKLHDSGGDTAAAAPGKSHIGQIQLTPNPL